MAEAKSERSTALALLCVFLLLRLRWLSFRFQRRTGFNLWAANRPRKGIGVMKKVKVYITGPIAGDAMPEYDQPSFSYPPGSVQLISEKLAIAWEASGDCTRVEEG